MRKRKNWKRSDAVCQNSWCKKVALTASIDSDKQHHLCSLIVVLCARQSKVICDASSKLVGEKIGARKSSPFADRSALWNAHIFISEEVQSNGQRGERSANCPSILSLHQWHLLKKKKKKRRKKKEKSTCTAGALSRSVFTPVFICRRGVFHRYTCSFVTSQHRSGLRDASI